jgi:formylglycine-generating enzyme required for sulfatase activity
LKISEDKFKSAFLNPFLYAIPVVKEKNNMNFSSISLNQWFIPNLLILLSFSILSACDVKMPSLRDPGGVEPLPVYQKQEQSLPITLVSSSHGKQILSSYSGSYALLIGESKYTNGWQNLGSIPEELVQVKKVLISQGFHVEKSLNLNARQLKDRIEKFIDKYGFDENNRLLFFYSGHGHTRNDKGYIVPTDAANPNFDEKGFLRKAVSMNLILTWARRIEAKHVLFLFDSCFSGAVFKAKNLSKIPRQISQAATEPVRQFITAGSAEETVPAKSVFTPAFIDALRFGWGDLYKDGYITGQELGLYLRNKVPQHIEQTPQYGKIKDYDLSRGDFVFIAGGNQIATVQPVIPAPIVVPSVPIVPVPIPKRDSDGDGVIDDQDACPNTSSGVTVKANGCSIPPPPPVVSDTPSQHNDTAGTVFRDRLKDGSKGPEMVWIPAGTFRMGDIQGGGDDDEQPVHRVSVKKFAMGRYEVTFAEYDQFAQATGRNKPNDEDWGRGNRPVINVSWNDATAYTKWLSQQTEQTYRLPTEAEWEYAARAGSDTKYWWGNEIGTNRAACDGCGAKWGWDAKKMTAPIGSFAPNQFGLYDTVGNVWEWTCSEYENRYKGKEKHCLSKNRANDDRPFVLRGGSWGIIAGGARSSAYRDGGSRTYRGRFHGFRLARLF